MATVASGDGPPAQSPQSADNVEKLNGEGDLDYTITMNESEDEASSDSSSNKLIKKENGKTSSSVKVNGKVASDDDSQCSVSKDAEVNEMDTLEKKNGEKEDGHLKEQIQDNGMEDDRSQDGEPCTDKMSVESKTTNKEEKVEEDHKDPIENDPVDDETSRESKAIADNSQEDHDTSQPGPKDTRDKSDKNEIEPQDPEVKNLPNEQKGEDEVEGQDSVEKEDLQGGQAVDEDDDVVEIEDSPEKQLVRKTLEGISKDKPPFVRVSNASVSGANFVPFLGSLPGSSLLSSSGMQFVQVAPGVQGSGLVYVPGTGNFQSSTTSASVFNPAMAGMNKIQSHSQHSSASVILPQYQNMMTNQNRFAMSQYNQGIRSAMAAPPVLTNIPDKPTSSIGMIENIRWEVENHINIKPKYAKPNPKAELGHLAKWTFDLGSDMVKEFVYHDLVRIQHCRNVEGALSDKEKEDFVKLQEIDRELNHKVGHLKFRLNKSCKCGFRTELDNVLYNHKQHAHIERGGFFNCILCKFSTRQPNTFRFHMESVHARPGFVENRPSFFECPLCPYETNYTNRLEQHKVRCQRQYREAFNLHPSCITGPEVNLCLENVFYFVFTRQFMNSIIPKTTTPVVSSTTKIRDIPSKEVTPVRNMQTRRGPTNTAVTTLTPSNKQLAPKTPAQLQQQAGAVKQQSQLGSALSRNFPVISSKIGTVPNQNVGPAYTSGRPQLPPQNQPHPPAPNQPNNGFEVCEICGGYVKDRKALRIHFYYAHRIDMPFGVFERPLAPLYCATCFARFWTAQGLQKHIEVHKSDMMGTTQTSNGVAGKCISCGHRVPNILMHMRMVHNRELRHYLAALMCIFCGSRFSTKKEVESHMGKMHGVIVKNSNVQGNIDKPQPANPMGPNLNQQQAKPSVPAQKPSPSTAAPKSRNSGKMNRGSQCVLCNLTFPRNVDLTRHCMRVHHTCMKCGLVVVDKESLARHTCLHSASGMRTCQICKESGFHPAYYIKHMRDKHLRKCSVVLRHIDRAVVETMKRPITISDSEEEEPSEKPTAPKCPRTDEAVKEIKMEPTSDTEGVENAQVSSEKENASETEASITRVGKEKAEESQKESAEIDQQDSDENEMKLDKADGEEGESELFKDSTEMNSRKDEFADRFIKSADEPDYDSTSIDNACDDVNNKNYEDSAEKSEDVEATDSKLMETHDKLEGAELVDDPDENQDFGVGVEKQSNEQEMENSGRKRKIDEIESENDDLACKSLRRNSQASEDQD